MAGKKGMKRKASTPTTDRARAWQSMRIMRRFTAPDLCRTSNAGLDNVRRYIRRLCRHGFVRQISVRGRGLPGEFFVYQLTRDIGPDHPIRCSKCGQAITAKECIPNDRD